MRKELIISLAIQRNLWYGSSYLTARSVEHDIIQRPRTLSHSIEGIALHFGCQVSAKRFSTLWKGVNVSLNFGIGPRKFCFLLSYYNTEYKLELPYENVWQIELHRANRISQTHLQLKGPIITTNKERPTYACRAANICRVLFGAFHLCNPFAHCYKTATESIHDLIEHLEARYQQ